MDLAKLLHREARREQDHWMADRIEVADREVVKLILVGARLLYEDDADTREQIRIGIDAVCKAEGPAYEQRQKRIGTLEHFNGPGDEELIQTVVYEQLEARATAALAMGIALGLRLGGER